MRRLMTLVFALTFAFAAAGTIAVQSADACGGPCTATYPVVPSGGDNIDIVINGGNVSNVTNVNISANGGTAIADASGGNGNSASINLEAGDAYGGDGYGGDANANGGNGGAGGNGGNGGNGGDGVGIGVGVGVGGSGGGGCFPFCGN